MQQKPEQMHIPGGGASAPYREGQPLEIDDPSYTPKESLRLRGMKWLKDRGLQYDSTPDDGDYLFLRSGAKGSAKPQDR